MKHIALIGVVLILVAGSAYASGYGHRPRASIEQEQEACIEQYTFQLGCKANQNQQEMAWLNQLQKAKGSGEINQEQEACINQSAVQLGKKAKQDQLLYVEIAQNQLACGERGPSICGRENRRPEIDQEQEACIEQLAVQRGVYSKQDQRLSSIVSQDQLNKSVAADVEQEQDACVRQVAVQIGVCAKQEQTSIANITQSQLNMGVYDEHNQSQSAGIRQGSLQIGEHSKQSQYQGAVINQTQIQK